MKRLFIVVVALVLLFLIIAPALAETPQKAAYGIDWTEVLVYVIGALGTFLAAVLARVWLVHVKPWLDQYRLTKAAYIVVDAVEAIIGRGLGSVKWDLAIDKMRERGFDINGSQVKDALKAAWEKLNLAQIEAGVKYTLEEGILLEGTIDIDETETVPV